MDKIVKILNQFVFGEQMVKTQHNCLHLVILFVVVTLVSCSPRMYYLHKSNNFTQSKELTELKKNSYDIPLSLVDCNKKDCSKYKAKQSFPLVVLWNGAGTSYKHLEEPNLNALQKLVQAKKENPLRIIINFLNSITLLQSFGVAFAIATTLYLIFSKLFRDKSEDAKLKNKDS